MQRGRQIKDEEGEKEKEREREKKKKSWLSLESASPITHRLISCPSLQHSAEFPRFLRLQSRVVSLLVSRRLSFSLYGDLVAPTRMWTSTRKFKEPSNYAPGNSHFGVYDPWWILIGYLRLFERSVTRGRTYGTEVSVPSSRTRFDESLHLQFLLETAEMRECANVIFKWPSSLRRRQSKV